MNMKKLLRPLSYQLIFPIACMLITSLSFATDVELERVFAKLGVEGTIVISSLDGKHTYVHNDQRANQRLSPASTFKIPNSLIAMEEKVLRDENETIPWDGMNRDKAVWNQNQTLFSAFKTSCIWAYQELAKKIGTETYIKYLTRMSYGNHSPGPELTTFWLAGGDLEITPQEQVAFLKAVYQQQYPFAERTYGILKKMMLEEQTENYSLYSKSGAATIDWVGHGWYVGCLETRDNTWFFATNILVNKYAELPLRKQVTFDCLRAKGIV